LNFSVKQLLSFSFLSTQSHQNATFEFFEALARVSTFLSEK
jgi:hypothetical protein